jgi:hypothetical protein
MRLIQGVLMSIKIQGRSKSYKIKVSRAVTDACWLNSEPDLKAMRFIPY